MYIVKIWVLLTADGCFSRPSCFVFFVCFSLYFRFKEWFLWNVPDAELTTKRVSDSAWNAASILRIRRISILNRSIWAAIILKKILLREAIPSEAEPLPSVTPLQENLLPICTPPTQRPGKYTPPPTKIKLSRCRKNIFLLPPAPWPGSHTLPQL